MTIVVVEVMVIATPVVSGVRLSTFLTVSFSPVSMDRGVQVLNLLPNTYVHGVMMFPPALASALHISLVCFPSSTPISGQVYDCNIHSSTEYGDPVFRYPGSREFLQLYSHEQFSTLP